MDPGPVPGFVPREGGACDRHRPVELIGQTVAINLALVPILLAATGVPYQLTIGWTEKQGRACFKHDDALIARFLVLIAPGADVR
jgi:hypothetical protein